MSYLNKYYSSFYIRFQKKKTTKTYEILTFEIKICLCDLLVRVH